MQEKSITNQKHFPEGAHLVGSIPFQNSEQVFRASCKVLGRYLRRLSDGETGERSIWIRWQYSKLASIPELEVSSDSIEYTPFLPLKLRTDIALDKIVIPPLGYAVAAKESYATFCQLKKEGVIPADMRFLITLPTPLAPITMYIVLEDRSIIEPLYEAKMLEEVREINAAIPTDQMAIQWDTCIEFALLEGLWPHHYDNLRNDIIERLIRLGNYIPSTVELGYHLCYGDSGHKHFKEPQDTSLMVQLANDIIAGLNRPLHWIHLPVPRTRKDVAYFSPLKQLNLSSCTELYLGLVHHTDNIDGTWERITSAQQIVPTFGVACECGLGRRPPETIVDLMHIHSAVASPVR